MAALLTRRSQVQWLALLAVAVLLPTVSLLWFMSHVVANERLVIHQKLASLYADKLGDAATNAERSLSNAIQSLEKINPASNPYASLRNAVNTGNAQGLVLWSSDGSLIYPRSDESAGADASSDHRLSTAWQLEFGRQQFAEAAAVYADYTNDSDAQIAVSAALGRSRCLARLQRLPDAIQACRDAAFPDTDVSDPGVRFTVENARLLLLSLLQQAGSVPQGKELYRRTVDALLSDVYRSDEPRPRLPPTQNLFVAKRTAEALRHSASGPDLRSAAELERLAEAEENSMMAVEKVRPFGGLSDRMFPVVLDERPMYGLHHRGDSGIALALFSTNGLDRLLAGYRTAFETSESAYRVVDASGDYIAGARSLPGNAFNVTPLPEVFPGWKVELFFRGGDVFERAARRQIAEYVWTGVLVIFLILIAAGLATQAVGRQIRLNQMKNDFIATVSHELKTPLASMRVLVDTLLEGHIRDEAQARQYLGMAAKENERLSRMIDNFLTFSRMERNKVTFVIADVDAAAIVRDAIESAKTKYETHHCQLTVDLPPALPALRADHDAVVTVLVNLLDNACKYTGPEKQIALRVSAENAGICFAVTDNGIGLARRHMRRIFDRFYQVDSSLARGAEGCGLGLSIVKFIVDAHKGKVTVESRVGKGSTFRVWLPAIETGDERR